MTADGQGTEHVDVLIVGAGISGIGVIDEHELKPFIRSVDRMPRQGMAPPWRLEHDDLVERDALPAADLDDGSLQYC